jgi:Arc/MetJ family transcription regulator
MPTNLAIDDALLNEAKLAGGHATKRETVEAALREYVLRRRRRQILDLFGQVDFDPRHDSKRARRRKGA